MERERGLEPPTTCVQSRVVIADHGLYRLDLLGALASSTPRATYPSDGGAETERRRRWHQVRGMQGVEGQKGSLKGQVWEVPQPLQRGREGVAAGVAAIPLAKGLRVVAVPE
ncbi:MAG: hypothetical protein ACK4K2_06900 [Dehalococcoidia bacterium]